MVEGREYNRLAMLARCGVRVPLLYLFATLLGLYLSASTQRTPMNLPPPPQAPNPSPITPNISSAAPKPKVNRAQLQREAKELLELSQSLQPDIESVNRGLLPKETIEKLKRIEKLSKHLRSELAP